MALKDHVLSEQNRAQVVRDAVRLVDDEVRGKSGISGMAIKTGYKAVCKIKPGLIQETVDHLLDRFVATLEPFFTEWDEGGRSGGFDAFLIGRKNKVANALLSVTDERARVTKHNSIRKTYNTLRPQGEKNVEAAVPGLGRLLAKYL